jgi:hypothetical protein
MQHNAHFANCLPNPTVSENNRLGATRFVDEEDANVFLESCFAKHIKTEPVPLFYDPIRDEYVRPKPEETEFRPIILLNFDESQLDTLQNTFGCHPSIWQNVVATSNTQSIASDQGFD